MYLVIHHLIVLGSILYVFRIHRLLVVLGSILYVFSYTPPSYSAREHLVCISYTPPSYSTREVIGNVYTAVYLLYTQAQIQSVIDANIIPGVIDLMKNGDFKSQKEAVWVITNLTSGGQRYIYGLYLEKLFKSLSFTYW